jgi:hypothetical protein
LRFTAWDIRVGDATILQWWRSLHWELCSTAREGGRIMADPKGSDESKSLEMRIAQLEDKLTKMHITEEEMRAYEKVSALMGGAAATGADPNLSPQVCQISRSRLVCINRGVVARQIVRFCFECTCGPCNPEGGGFSGGGGFGGFGM